MSSAEGIKDAPETGFTICLWCNNNAEEAVAHYTSTFKDSRVIHTAYYPGAGEERHGHEPGTVMTIVFELRGQRFSASSPKSSSWSPLCIPLGSGPADRLGRQWPSTAAPTSPSTRPSRSW